MRDIVPIHPAVVEVGPDHRGLWFIASDQGGYFTADQARSCRISGRLLSHHAATGRYLRVRQGLYRLRDFPPSPHEEVRAGWLAVGAGRGVVSHESALALHDLADVIPAAVHVTVPRALRWLPAPEGVALHTVTRPLDASDIALREGIRLTVPERTLLDVAEAGTAPEQVVRGVLAALAQGLVVADQLRTRAGDRGVRVARLVARAIDDLPSSGSGTGAPRP